MLYQEKLLTVARELVSSRTEQQEKRGEQTRLEQQKGSKAGLLLQEVRYRS